MESYSHHFYLLSNTDFEDLLHKKFKTLSGLIAGFFEKLGISGKYKARMICYKITAFFCPHHCAVYLLEQVRSLYLLFNHGF